MKRLRIELDEVAAAPNLEAALWAAARGKCARADVAAYLAEAPRRLGQLREALLEARLVDGRLCSFMIRDPKPRLIHAAPFVDRVAHHALMRLMEPRLERALVPTSYACRPGRGVHAALARALEGVRAHPWVLQLDVRHCFPRIAHERLLGLLSRRFKGSALRLAATIIRSHEASPGRGLPIGSLTSQHFANAYLGEIDREAISLPPCLAHVRYMDDLLLFCGSEADANALHARLADFATLELDLQFKPPRIARTRFGVTFCGMRVRPEGLRAGERRRRVWTERWRALREDVAAARIGAREAQRRAGELRALLLPARPAPWQRRLVAGADDV